MLPNTHFTLARWDRVDRRQRQTPPPHRPTAATLSVLTASPPQSSVNEPRREHNYFGAGEATSFWKRGSFRSGSNIGSSRSSAGVSGTLLANGPLYGIESNFCKAAIARSGSPIVRRNPCEDLDWDRTSYRVLLNWIRGYGALRQRQRAGLVAKTHHGQREISNENIIFRLFFEERFQFAARLAPTFLGGGMVARDILSPT